MKPATRIEQHIPVLKTGGGKAIAPGDVCLTPMGPGAMVPVPYVNTARAKDLQGGSHHVTINKSSVMLVDSRLYPSRGNERGLGGGIISRVSRGIARSVSRSTSVRIEGQAVVLDKAIMMQNSGNAIGKLSVP